MDKRVNNGGERDGAGRPKIGQAKSIKLVLHPSVWTAIDADLEAFGQTVKLPALIRSILTEAYWEKMKSLGLELPVYPINQTINKVEEANEKRRKRL